MSEEDKISFGKKLSGKNNPNYKNRGVNSPLYGIPLSKEHRENISKALKGRKLTEKQIEAIREFGF